MQITSLEKPLPNRLMLLKWQNMLDFVANLFGVSASKITKVGQEAIDIVLTAGIGAESISGHSLGSGGMDEAVIGKGEVLAIENSDEDSLWSEDMTRPTAYLGMPIVWPDHEVFGTLSIEDCKEHRFTERYHKIMDSFREMVNTDLALLMATDRYNRRSAYSDMKTIPIPTGICIYSKDNKIISWNKSAEEILVYLSEEVSGKPVGTIFPMINDIVDRQTYNVMAGNSEMKQLYIEKSEILGPNNTIAHVLSFSDQTDYITHLNGVGELYRDKQTGVYDYRSIVNLLEQESKRALRYKQPLSVIGIRIDGYEFIDELHGKGSLDLVVQTIAIILKHETRDVDCIGRLTDELFIVGLPSTPVKAGKAVAARIDKVASRYNDDATPFTITTGVEELTEQVEDWEEWIFNLLAKH